MFRPATASNMPPFCGGMSLFTVRLELPLCVVVLVLVNLLGELLLLLLDLRALLRGQLVAVGVKIVISLLIDIRLSVFQLS